MTTSYNQDFVIRQAIAQLRNFSISRTRDTDNYEKATKCLTFKVFLLFLLKKKYISQYQISYNYDITFLKF